MVAVLNNNIKRGNQNGSSKFGVGASIKQISICIVLLLVFMFGKEPPIITTLNVSHVTTKNVNDNPAFPRYEEIQGIPVLWTVPSSSSTKPCGILFMAHGCSHSMTDWFAKSPSCEDCIGLPEEIAIVDIALKANLVVVAISSQNRFSKCWSIDKDGPRVLLVLQEFSNTRYPNVPVYAFGASSGGSFVSQLPKYNRDLQQNSPVEINGYISQIAAHMAPTPDLDCAVYITMNLDSHTDKKAKSIVADKTHNVQTKHIRVPPIPMSGTYFSDRIIEITESESKLIIQALQKAGMVSKPEGRWTDNPRSVNWQTLVRPFVPLDKDSLVADQSPISEVVNVAYGQHEMTRDGFEEALQFCFNAVATSATNPNKKYPGYSSGDGSCAI